MATSYTTSETMDFRGFLVYKREIREGKGWALLYLLSNPFFLSFIRMVTRYVSASRNLLVVHVTDGVLPPLCIRYNVY